MLLRILLGILIAGYVGINFVVDIPIFLMGENLTYAVLYAIGLVYLSKRYAVIFLIALTAFNAGRLSRTIIEPTGEIGSLALQHLPLLLLILVVLGLLVRQLIKHHQ